MVFLKEDGSLDLKRIKSLPLEKRLKMVAKMTESQYRAYVLSFNISECSQRPIKPIVVNYSFEEFISSGKGVEAFSFIKKMEEKYLNKP